MTQLTFYGGVEEIGGNKILVESSAGTVLLDFGRRMGFTGNYYAEFIQPRSKNALRDLCRLGVLPIVDGIYSTPFIDTTLLVDKPEFKAKIPLDRAPDYWVMQGIAPYDKEKPRVDAIFITHAHFDHIQDLSFLDPAIPIHCTEETRVVAKAINDVSVSGVDDQYYELRRKQVISTKPRETKDLYKTLFPGELAYFDSKEEGEKPCVEEPKCGYEFTREYTPEYRTFDPSLKGAIKGIRYELIPVDHSIPGACSILLTLPNKKRLLYTGDLRFHGTKSTTIDDYVERVGEPIDALIIEGTRIDSEQSLRESDVEKNIKEDISKALGLILINFGWKDLSRYEVVYKCTIAADRTLIISPKLAYLLFEMHFNFPDQYPDPLKVPNLKVYLKREDSLLYSKADYDKWKMGYLDFHGRNTAKKDQNLVRIAESLNCGGEKCTCTEPLVVPDTDPINVETFELATHHLKHGIKAFEIRENPSKYVMLFTNMDVNELFDLLPKDAVPPAHYISAATEPFNDEMEIDESKFMNWLDAFGVTYEYEEDEEKHKHFVRRHVSGHASQPELLDLINKLNPGMIIPIHTINPHQFEKLLPGKTIKIPEYGKPIPL